MRILIATCYQAIIGGAETYLRDLMPALREQGHEVGLVVEELAAPNARRINEDDAGPCWRLTRSSQDRVFSEIMAWQPAFCYLQGLDEPAFQRELAQRLPTILFAHNYHGTCISGNKRFAFPVERPCGKTFGLACMLHYFVRGCGGKNPVTMVHQYRRQRERFELLAQYRGIIVASRAMREEYLHHGIAGDHIHCVPLFPTGAEPIAEPTTAHERTGTILLLGRLSDTKGAHLAIEAVQLAARKLTSSIKLIIAGDGPERDRLERLAFRLGVPARFLGWIDSLQRTEILDQADLMLMPSVWPEPFGLVGLEAACSGVPTVAFAVGGIPDWLVPGQTGELAPGDPPTVGGLADALVRALADETHYQRLRLGAWHSTKTFQLADHVKRLEAIFESVCNESLVQAI